MSEWKKFNFLDVVSLNPRIGMEKGTEYPFVEMSNSVPGARKPEKDVRQVYNGGGAKFEKGDTVVARIEPCLQNGKGFQCSYEKGFGSTEFLVFRPLSTTVMDCNFLYYYMAQKTIREAMAKTMVGASGRQRVNNAVFNDLSINLPPLSIQHHIAIILSRYDSLIENYQQQINLLDESAQRLYKDWFIDLRFPDHGSIKTIDGVPEGWRRKKLSEIASLKAGGDKPEIVSETKTSTCKIPIYSNGTSNEGLYGYTNMPEILEQSVTISARGSVGYTVLRRTPYVPIVRLISVIPNEVYVGYIYFCLKNTTLESNGAAQQQITVPMIKGKEVIVPSKEVLDSFKSILEPIFCKIDKLKEQISFLTEARDRLLPKLMNGEISVETAQSVTNGLGVRKEQTDSPQATDS